VKNNKKRYIQIIAYMVLIFPFFVPPYITTLISNNVISMMKVMAFAVISIMFLKTNKIPKNILYFLVYSIILFLANYFAEHRFFNNVYD
jgi:heme O synthase-like polyprenyltransferase